LLTVAQRLHEGKASVAGATTPVRKSVEQALEGGPAVLVPAERLVCRLCRQKQKSLLDGVVAQREALQQRLYQAEVQVRPVHAAAVCVDAPDPELQVNHGSLTAC